MEIGGLTALITAQDADFNRKLAAADRKGKATAASLKSTFANTRLTVPTPRFDTAALARAAQGAGRSLTIGLTAPLALLGGAAVKSAVDFDSLKQALETTTGSATEAATQLARLEQIAKLPGLGLSQVIEGSVNLQAAGFSAQLAERSLKAFGNALAGVGKGKAELDGINLALTQLATSAQPLQEEINQIRERLPQFQKLMIAAFGSARSEDIQKLGITGKQFVERMVVELEKLPKAGGGARNTFDNLSDAAQQSGVKIGTAILRVAVPALEKLTPKIEAAAAAFDKLSPEAQNAALGITAVALAAGPTLSAIANVTIAVSGLTSGARALQAAIGALTLGRLAAVGAGLTAAGVAAGTLLQDGGSPYTTKLRKEADERAQRARIRATDFAPDTPDPLTDMRTPAYRTVPGGYRPKPLPRPNPFGAGVPKLTGGGGGRGAGGRAAEITEAARLSQQLAELNREIAYLGNASSREYQLRLAVAGAEEARDNLQQLITLRRTLFDEGPTGELGQLQALQKYDALQKQNRELPLVPFDDGIAQGVLKAAEAYNSLRNAIEDSRPALKLTNEQRLAVGDLTKEFAGLNSIEKQIVLTRAQSADAAIKAAQATEQLDAVSGNLNAELERLNQSASVYLNTFRELSLAGHDMASAGVRNVLKVAQGVDTRKREQAEQDRVAGETQRFEERMRGIGQQLGQDFDDLIGSIFEGQGRWKDALANLAKDFFNSLAQEFFLAATGGQAGSLGELLGNIVSNLLKNLFSSFGGGGLSGLGSFALTIPSLGAASGGAVSGPGSGTSDSIPARLSHGEYVVQAAAVNRYGRGFFDRVNEMRLPAFAMGGHVGNEPSFRLADFGGPLRLAGEPGEALRDRNTPAAQPQQRPIINQNFHITAHGGNVPQATQAQLATRAAEGAQKALRRNG